MSTTIAVTVEQIDGFGRGVPSITRVLHADVTRLTVDEVGCLTVEGGAEEQFLATYNSRSWVSAVRQVETPSDG